MASPFQPPQLPRRRLARRINKYGCSSTFPPSSVLGFRHSSRWRTPARVLAGLFEMGWEILVGSFRGAAASSAADRARILCAPSDGPARATGKIVAIVFRPWLGVHVRRP